MESRFCVSRPSVAGRRVLARMTVVALAATTILLSAGCSSKSANEAPAPTATARDVKLTPAQLQNIHLYTVAASRFRKTIETSGAVDFDNDRATSVLAPFSGPVSKLLVAQGDRVAKGQPLALVDSPDFATAIGAYRKALATAHTARRLADLEKDLVQHQGVAERDADQAETDAANADADRAAALQELIALNVDAQTIRSIEQGKPVVRADGVIRAPIAGIVVERLVNAGQLLQAGTTPCFTLADLARVWVMAQVSGAELAAVHVGDPADIAIGSDSKTLPGTVTNIADQVSPDTRLVAARVVVENPDGLLKKQMYVGVSIHAREESSGLLVPVSAILRDDENLPFVYVAEHDGSFARRPVTLGYRSADQVDLTSGIQIGDPIVVDGGIFVQFMQNQ